METTKESVNGVKNGLNPYYNGRYSWRGFSFVGISVLHCLNPYYNGRYSWRGLRVSNLVRCFVLILIIMEDTHGEQRGARNVCQRHVLILIIMEDTHGD